MAENKTVLIVLVCCLSIVGVAGLILGAISLSRMDVSEINIYNQITGGNAADSGSDRVWTIAIGHVQNNIEYLDPVTNQIKGFTPDIIEAVCDIANKNCELVWDLYSNCWDSKAGQRPRGGFGLMSGWYDACAGWAQAYNRLLTFGFTKPFRKGPQVALYVRNDSTTIYTDLTGLNFGFIDGFWSDEFCIGRYGPDGITGIDLQPNQVFHYTTGQQLADAVLSGEVDIAFTPIKQPAIETNLKRISPDDFPERCLGGGPSMMAQKRNTEFVEWWNEAFRRLVGTKRYFDICENVLKEHALYPGQQPNELCLDG